MMNGEFVKQMEESTGKYEVKHLGGHNFHVNRVEAKLIKLPVQMPLVVFGLTQLLNYIKVAGVSDAFLSVVSHNQVKLISHKHGPQGEIVVIADADFSEVFSAFECGSHQNQSDFILDLMTKFEFDEVRQNLIKVVSSVKAGAIQTSDDDGFSQKVNVKAGVSLVTEEKIKNLWELRTLVTFPELEQPIIPYVLRLHGNGDRLPNFSLHECDGGLWKVKTAARVREFCQRYLTDSSVTGVTVL